MVVTLDYAVTATTVQKVEKKVKVIFVRKGFNMETAFLLGKADVIAAPQYQLKFRLDIVKSMSQTSRTNNEN